MAWTSPRTWVTGETVTAALLNTHVRDEFNALMVVTTKGDLAVATASVTLTRLAVGANGDVLVADSAATPGVRWSSTGKTASAAIGRNINIANTLTAAANNDQLEQTRITGVFAKSTFTGLTAMQLYIQTSGATSSGAGTIDDFYGIYINGAPTLGTTNWTLYSTNGNMVLAASSGKIFIGDTAHGGFGVTETDNFGLAKKVEAANGGLDIQGFGDGEFGAMLTGYVTTIVTTKATSSNAQVVIRGADNTANSNILAVQVSGWTTRFILDADGDSHQDVGTAWTNFDRENDIDLLNTLAAHVTRKDDPLRRGFGKWLRERRGRLEELKLVTFNRDGHHFVNMSRLTMLHTGALRELGAKLEAQAERLLLLEKKVLQLMA